MSRKRDFRHEIGIRETDPIERSQAIRTVHRRASAILRPLSRRRVVTTDGGRFVARFFTRTTGESLEMANLDYGREIRSPKLLGRTSEWTSCRYASTVRSTGVMYHLGPLEDVSNPISWFVDRR